MNNTVKNYTHVMTKTKNYTIIKNRNWKEGICHHENYSGIGDYNKY